MKSTKFLMISNYFSKLQTREEVGGQSLIELLTEAETCSYFSISPKRS